MKIQDTINLRDDEERILMWLIANKQGYAREIEHQLNMQQPVSSKYLNSLIKRNYISSKNKKQPHSRGRPQILYYIKDSNSTIINLMTDIKRELRELEHQSHSLELYLRSLINQKTYK